MMAEDKIAVFLLAGLPVLQRKGQEVISLASGPAASGLLYGEGLMGREASWVA